MVEISQLLWAAQGRTSRLGGRTAPSAGALYPLELYLLLPDALHRYVPSRRRIELVAEADLGLGLGRPRRWRMAARRRLAGVEIPEVATEGPLR